MNISEVAPDDHQTIAGIVGLVNAAYRVDAPFSHPETPSGYAGLMRVGWDGEPPRVFVAGVSDAVVGVVKFSISDWGNPHMAWVDILVHPEARRSGVGTSLLEFAKNEARSLGRTHMALEGWDNNATKGFALAHGIRCVSSAVGRRQQLGVLSRPAIEELYADASAAASAYEFTRISGRTPPELLEAVADMTAAINDAPRGEMAIEDEAFPAERIIAYEAAQQARGKNLYRVVARHRPTGRLAGHTVVAVDKERPTIGEQHDTSVLRAHRGHRLGLALKADALRWLADEEPQLQTIDTWNAETNHHMVSVNERLGYRMLGRMLQFQLSL